MDGLGQQTAQEISHDVSTLTRGHIVPLTCGTSSILFLTADCDVVFNSQCCKAVTRTKLFKLLILQVCKYFVSVLALQVHNKNLFMDEPWAYIALRKTIYHYVVC